MIFDDPFFVATSRGVSWHLVASREVRAHWCRPWVQAGGVRPASKGKSWGGGSSIRMPLLKWTNTRQKSIVKIDAKAD